MDDALERLAALIPEPGEPVDELTDEATGQWRVRATKLTVRLDLDERTAVRLTDTIRGLAPDPLDGQVLTLVRVVRCEVGEKMALEVRDETGTASVVAARKVKYLQEIEPDVDRRRHGHLDRLKAAVAAGGDSPDDRRAALHFGAKWSAIGEVYDMTGVKAAAEWQAGDRAELARLRAAREEAGGLQG